MNVLTSRKYHIRSSLHGLNPFRGIKGLKRFNQFKTWIRAVSIAVGVTLPSLKAYSFSYSLGIGPTSLGVGGSNPPSGIRAYEYQGLLLFDDHEFLFSVAPGIFWSKRSSTKGAYISFGGGMVVDANGIGPGVNAGFGYNAFCEDQCLNIEFRKAIGFVSGHILAPYAVRIGLTHIL